MKKRPSCFFCYAWGSEERYKKLEFLRKEIMQKTESQIEVILDRHDYQDNQDFEELRERIKIYDLVLVFCTPDFKKIVQDKDAITNKDREVLKEYRIIEERFNDNPSSVFPIILEGTKENSLLDLFRNKNARIFDDFRIRNNKMGRLIVPDNQKIKYGLFIGRIINTAIYNRDNKSVEYRNSRDALDKLFRLTSITQIPNSCLIIPDIFWMIRSQECFLIAGRKGSGKSTFINNFREMDRQYFDGHYKKMIPIYAEAFQHDDAYNNLIEKHKQDLNIVTSYDILCLFWQIYFILQSIVTIRGEIEAHNITASDSRYAIFNKVTNKLKEKIGLRRNRRTYRPISSDSVPKAIFQAAIELIDEQFTKGLDRLSGDELIATTFVAKFNAQEIIEGLFGVKDIEKFIDALRSCQKKIFISLDGFDTHSEDFRIYTERLPHDSEDYRRRSEYEMLFFRTLIEVVTKFKFQQYHDNIASAFGEYIDFCIVLPKDRYDQVVDFDRDSFKKRYGSLTWSAMELMELITKRLEYLIETIKPGSITETSADLFQRWDNALDFFPGLPHSISMNIQGNTVKMSLFNYILRSSFWRPRDVISNMSCLLARIVRIGTNQEWINDLSVKLSEEEIKLAIKDNASRIIQEEFVDEYKYVFRNLREVLKRFEGLDEEMKVEEFKELLSAIEFNASYSYDLRNVNNKLKVLYQLGVIGLRYDKELAANLHYLNNICFVFTAGMTVFDDFLKHKMRNDTDVTFVFNPIFARELMLSFNTKELLGDWSDEDIRENHRNKNLIRPL